MSKPADGRGADDAATAILETVPLAMRAIRGHMRQGRPAGMSVPQFRALLYVRRHPGTGLSEIADHLGTSVPAASELVGRLVGQDLVVRATDPGERRRIQLTLSRSGMHQLEGVEERATEWLRGLVGRLDGERARTLVVALADLRSLVQDAIREDVGSAGSLPLAPPDEAAGGPTRPR
jgi:DNA-binding MarR family transcriptional regulator